MTSYLSVVEERAGFLREFQQQPENLWSKQSIYRIPSLIRDLEPKVYEPRVVSIGPYHHGAKKHLQAMEEHKHRALRHFISRLPNERTLEYVIGQFRGEGEENFLDKVRNCYAKSLDEQWFDDDTFLHLMVLDGCFLLELLMSAAGINTCASHGDTVPPTGRCYANNDPIFGGNSKKKGLVPYVKMDMLLLENQIPLIVLERLARIANMEVNVNELILSLYGINNKGQAPSNLGFDQMWSILMTYMHNGQVPSNLGFFDRKSLNRIKAKILTIRRIFETRRRDIESRRRMPLVDIDNGQAPSNLGFDQMWSILMTYIHNGQAPSNLGFFDQMWLILMTYIHNGQAPSNLGFFDQMRLNEVKTGIESRRRDNEFGRRVNEFRRRVFGIDNGQAPSNEGIDIDNSEPPSNQPIGLHVLDVYRKGRLCFGDYDGWGTSFSAKELSDLGVHFFKGIGSFKDIEFEYISKAYFLQHIYETDPRVMAAKLVVKILFFIFCWWYTPLWKSKSKFYLPHLIIDESVALILLNLMAFERLHLGLEVEGGEEVDMAVTRYVFLMSSLVRSEKDVEYLRRKSILSCVHGLSDESVVKLFSDLVRNSTFSNEMILNEEIEELVVDRADNAFAKWRRHLDSDLKSKILVVLSVYGLVITLVNTVLAFLNYFRPKTRHSTF